MLKRMCYYVENWICDLRIPIFLKIIQWFNRRRWRRRGYTYSKTKTEDGKMKQPKATVIFSSRCLYNLCLKNQIEKIKQRKHKKVERALKRLIKKAREK